MSALARILRCAVALVAAAGAVRAAPALAGERALVLDAQASKVELALGATLHTVHGTIRLTRGEIRFDAATGEAAGEIVLDAPSVDTGNDTRDEKLHREVLESGRFPAIVFRPRRLEVVSQGATTAEVRLHGVLVLHGTERPLAIQAQLAAQGDRLTIAARFRVSYVEWGVTDPSNLVLRVDPFVDVTVAAVGTLLGP